MNEVEEYYLQHAGVKGMKWGVRKKRETKTDKIRQNRNIQKAKMPNGEKKPTKEYTDSNKNRKPLNKKRIAAIALEAAAVGIVGTYAYSMASNYKLETDFDVNSYLRGGPYGRGQPSPDSTKLAKYIIKQVQEKGSWRGYY